MTSVYLSAVLSVCLSVSDASICLSSLEDVRGERVVLICDEFRVMSFSWKTDVLKWKRNLPLSSTQVSAVRADYF